MSLGMIVRADFGRGLARQTYSFWQHLKPDVTVVIDMSMITDKWTQDLHAYPGGIVTKWRGYTAPFENPEAYEALRSTDMIYTAETHYDERLQDHPSILHVNPEFFRGQQATQYWYPTGWMLDRLPPGHVVPTPITEVADTIARSDRPLHVAGHKANGDRNGTRIAMGAIQKSGCEWKLTTQDGLRIHPHVLSRVEVVGNVEDHRDLYADAGVLVYPRRYGGQSLQVNEAMSFGLAVMMTDCEPNREWPIIPIPSRPMSRIRTPGGPIQLHQASPQMIADMLGMDLEPHKHASLEWAHANTWEQWADRIGDLIAG